MGLPGWTVVQTAGRRCAYRSSASRRLSSSSLSFRSTAWAQSRAEAGRLAPGIGITWSPLASIQASTTCWTDTPWSFETLYERRVVGAQALAVANAAERAPRQERNAESPQCSSSPSLERNEGENWFCTLTKLPSPRMERARSI